MKRLFFALEPNPAIRKDVNKIISRLDDKSCRKTSTENIHITLVFLGLIAQPQERDIIKAVENITIPSFEILFDQLAYWRKPRILCLNSSAHNAPIEQLVEDIKAKVNQCGVATETRAFKPHVTLARKVNHKIEIPFESLLWRADQFCLMESCSVTGGVRYQVLKRWG